MMRNKPAYEHNKANHILQNTSSRARKGSIFVSAAREDCKVPDQEVVFGVFQSKRMSALIEDRQRRMGHTI